MQMQFDPMRDVLFRGKRIDALSPEETREALVQSLKYVKHLQDGGGTEAFVRSGIYFCPPPSVPKDAPGLWWNGYNLRP